MVFCVSSMQGQVGNAIRVDESTMTVTAAAGITQRTLLKYLDNFRCCLLLLVDACRWGRRFMVLRLLHSTHNIFGMPTS